MIYMKRKWQRWEIMRKLMNKLSTKKKYYLLVEKEITKFGKCTQTLDYELVHINQL